MKISAIKLKSTGALFAAALVLAACGGTDDSGPALDDSLLHGGDAKTWNIAEAWIVTETPEERLEESHDSLRACDRDDAHTFKRDENAYEQIEGADVCQADAATGSVLADGVYAFDGREKYLALPAGGLTRFFSAETLQIDELEEDRLVLYQEASAGADATVRTEIALTPQ